MNHTLIGIYLLLFLSLMLINMFFYMFLTLLHEINANDIEKNESKLKETILKRLRYVEEHKNSCENRALIAVYVLTFIGGGLFINTTYSLYCEYVIRFIEHVIRPDVISESISAVLFSLLYIFLLCLFFVLLLAFFVLIPRRLAKRMQFEGMAHFISFVMVISSFLRPITHITDKLAKGILFLFGIKKHPEENDVTEEEIISMVNEGHEQGVLEASEAEMIHNIFEFADKEVQDIMTKRNQMVAIDANMSFPEAIEFMIHEKNSRFPIYEENLDHIIGIVNLKDAIRFSAVSKKARGMLKNYPGIIRKAVFVPETKNIDDLFKEMQSQKLQMVIVLDEYGQTSGLVALEDILEEIVGNILDEYDVEEEYIEERSDNVYEIDGLTPLADVEEELGIVFDTEEFDTLNGFMISKLEHIPAEDEIFVLDYKGYLFEILEVENRIIKTVLVTKSK